MPGFFEEWPAPRWWRAPPQPSRIGSAAGRSNHSAAQEQGVACPDQPPPAPEAAPAAPAAAGPSRVEQLKELGELKAQGVLADAEFEAEKARILA